MKPGRAGNAARRPARPAIVVFLALWLILWTASILFVAAALLSGAKTGGETPLTIWLAISAGGWLIGVFLLRRALRGRPVRRAPGVRTPPPDIGKAGPGGDGRGGPGDGDGD